MHMTTPGRLSGRSKAVCMYSTRHAWARRQNSLRNVRSNESTRAALRQAQGLRHLGDGEGEVTVRHREQDRFGDQCAEKLDLLLVAGRTEPASFAGEGKQVFVRTVVTPHAGESVRQVAAVHELVHDFRDDRPQKAVARLKKCLVGGKKDVEVPGQALPERRSVWFPLAVGLHLPRYMQTGRKILHIPKRENRATGWRSHKKDRAAERAGHLKNVLYHAAVPSQVLTPAPHKKPAHPLRDAPVRSNCGAI